MLPEIHTMEKCDFSQIYNLFSKKTVIAAMHGPHNVFDIGHCMVIHGDAGSVSLVDQ